MISLTVEGGASRTYFAVGVMDVMMKNNIPIDYITGASAGISNAMNYASKQTGRGLELGLNYVPKKEYSGFRHLLNPKNKSFYNIEYVFKTVPDTLCPYDYEAFKNFNGICEAAVTNVVTGKTEYIKIDNPQDGWDILVASCSLPLMFPIKEIKGKRYLDGGITDAVPFKRAIEMGCSKNIVILSREREFVKPQSKSEKITSLMYKKYPLFAKALKERTNMYNSQRDELFRLEKEGKVFIIAPKSTKGWKRTENDREKIKGMYDEGYKTGMEIIDNLKNYLSKKESAI